MSKKETVKFVPPVPEMKPVVETPLFESEAYGNPQPDAGMETTVLKPVGMGAPVPIVAPKHNTIQLQPIIVPLAVVPYMTQDSDVLRAESASSGTQFGYDDVSAAEFQKTASEAGVKSKAKATKKNAAARVCALIVFLFAAVQVLFYLLAKWVPSVVGLDLSPFNVLDIVAAWARDKIVPVNKEIMILYSIAAGSSGILVLTSLLSLIIGKYPRAFASVMALLSAAPVGAALIFEVVKGTFVAKSELALIILTAVSVACFLLSVIFVFVGNRKKNSADSVKESKKANFDSDSLI